MPRSYSTPAARRSQRGFTLFEVVVAFTVLALSLIGIYQIWYGSATRTNITTKQDQALRIAQFQLDNAVADRQFDAAQTSGTQNGMDWTVTTEPFATTIVNGTFDWQPMKVRVDVTWPRRGVTEGLSLSTVTLFHRN